MAEAFRDLTLADIGVLVLLSVLMETIVCVVSAVVMAHVQGKD